MSAPARAAWLQVARKVMCRHSRGSRKEEGVAVGWDEVGSVSRLGPGGGGDSGREEESGEGGGGGAGLRQRARELKTKLAQTLTRALARSLQPPPRLGEGGLVSQSSGWKRRDPCGIGGVPARGRACERRGSCKDGSCTSDH